MQLLERAAGGWIFTLNFTTVVFQASAFHHKNQSVSEVFFNCKDKSFYSGQCLRKVCLLRSLVKEGIQKLLIKWERTRAQFPQHKSNSSSCSGWLLFETQDSLPQSCRRPELLLELAQAMNTRVKNSTQGSKCKSQSFRPCLPRQ